MRLSNLPSIGITVEGLVVPKLVLPSNYYDILPNIRQKDFQPFIDEKVKTMSDKLGELITTEWDENRGLWCIDFNGSGSTSMILNPHSFEYQAHNIYTLERASALFAVGLDYLKVVMANGGKY